MRLRYNITIDERGPKSQNKYTEPVVSGLFQKSDYEKDEVVTLKGMDT